MVGRNQSNLYWRAFQYFAPERWAISGAIVLLALNTAVGLLKPWPFAVAVDILLGKPVEDFWFRSLIQADRVQTLVGLAVAAFCLQGVQAVLSAGQNALVISAGLSGLAGARSAVFQKLLSRSMAAHQGASIGDSVYRASWDVHAFQTFLHKGVFTALTATVSLVGMVWVMAKMNANLTWIACLTAPLLVIVMRWFGPIMTVRSTKAHQNDSEVASVVQSKISALSLIQAYGQQPRELRDFQERIETSRSSRSHQHRVELLYLLCTTLVFGAGLALLLGVGLLRVNDGTLSLGSLLVFLAYAGQLFEPLNQLSYVGASLADARASMSRVFELLDEPEELADKPNAATIQIIGETPFPTLPQTNTASPPRHTGPGKLELRSISFRYPNGRPVLNDFSATLWPGEKIAIRGPSGSGKSTLLRLLCRFYDPQAGCIEVDGRDLRDIKLTSWREQLALVPQESVILKATIIENIAYGRPQASREEIENAAKMAFADQFIRSFERGYDTLLGEGGARLSVGEMQRIGLARAYLKNAPILLLDEPTSALDRQSEALVVESLRSVSQGRTLIFVTHNDAPTSLADRIVQMV